jgi:type VI secretion system protein ImpK
MSQATTPSLLGNNATAVAFTQHSFTPHSLLDLMYDGFYALFLLKHKSAPLNNATFSGNISRFLEDFDRDAKKLGASAEDIHAAKYAYCSAVDEIILRSNFDIRTAWERQPLQLTIFGDQLAGEHFFHMLESLRIKGAAHIQALEVFHMCLLLGFEGKYIIEGPEKLQYLTARLGDEIALMKGKNAGFAPHWARPDQVFNKLRNEVPLWIICSVFALIGIAGYSGLHWMLSNATMSSINAYNEVIQLAPRAANITITLP